MKQTDFTTPERLGIAAILGIALLTFFFPLLVIHVPIAGDQSVSGYDVFSRVTEFQHDAGDSVAAAGRRRFFRKAGDRRQSET